MKSTCLWTWDLELTLNWVIVLESFWKIYNKFGNPCISDFWTLIWDCSDLWASVNFAAIVIRLFNITALWSFFSPAVSLPSLYILMASSQVLTCFYISSYKNDSEHPGQLNFRILRKALILLWRSTGIVRSRHWLHFHWELLVWKTTQGPQNKTEQFLFGHILASKTTFVHNLQRKWWRIGLREVCLKFSPSTMITWLDYIFFFIGKIYINYKNH